MENSSRLPNGPFNEAWPVKIAVGLELDPEPQQETSFLTLHLDFIILHVELYRFAPYLLR